MKKIERLISIVMILLQRKMVTATEMSHLFEVTVRTIQRDMETLTLANIPIYSILGSQGGYGLIEEYKFDKRLMTNEDIENVLIALSGFEGLVTSMSLQQTVEKIKGMTINTVDFEIDFSFYHFVGRTQIFEEVLLIRQAIRENRIISFDYVDQQGRATRREIEPYHLSLREMRWYIYGYDLNKLDFRTFKITRSTQMEKGKTFSPRRNIETKGMIQSPQKLVEVTLELDLVVRDQFIERYGSESLIQLTDRRYKTIIKLPSNQFGYQFIAGFGPNIKIIEPSSYQQAYKKFLISTLEIYNK